MTMPTEQASQRRRSKWYDRAPGTLDDREFALRAVYHHFPDQEVLDDLHEELRQHREHFVWLESEGHSLSQAASGLRKKIEQLEEQIETLRATGRFP
jgi:phage shock protein A